MANRNLDLIKDDVKFCPGCKLFVPFEGYHKNKNYWHGLAIKCKACVKKVDAERNSRPEVKLRTRATQVKRLYDITLDEVEQIKLNQGNSCLACKISFDVEPCHIDHDHDLNKFRFLLCRRCNWGLGSLRNNPFILRSAANYLEENLNIQNSITIT